jgi:large subunit ribosomal protein L3
MNKKNYLKIELTKQGMSQMFDDESKVLPYTELKLTSEEQVKHFEEMAFKSKVKVEAKSKGKGFAGAMKRWGFHGSPASHGVKDTHRSPGSIGAQGYGRVIPGKKMAGRYGNKNITVITKFLGFNKDALTISVKGGVPGARNSKVIMYLEHNEN